MTIMKYGRKPDLPDQRDFLFAARPEAIAPFPQRYRAFNYGIDDQGQLGSCVGHGVEGSYRQLLHRENIHDYVGSRLGVYYCARAIEGTIPFDAGAQIRDGVKAISLYGVMPDALWPYDITQFANQPPETAYVAATKHIAIQYHSVDNTSYDEICSAIYQNSNLIIGITVYESFESSSVARNGMVPMPAANERVLGGHCMRAIGYTEKNLIVANSWGTGWGDFGLCYLPKAYVTNPNLASDFWTLVKVD